MQIQCWFDWVGFWYWTGIKHISSSFQVICVESKNSPMFSRVEMTHASSDSDAVRLHACTTVSGNFKYRKEKQINRHDSRPQIRQRDRHGHDGFRF